MDRASQTTGLRKVHIINPGLCKIAAHVNINFPVLQVRSLVWGLYDQHHAIEVSRIKADIPPKRGGPATVTVVRVTDSGAADLIVAGDVIESVTGLLDEDKSFDMDRMNKLLEKLGVSYVFCTGVSKEEYNTVCSGCTYVSDSFVEKHVPFNRFTSRNCFKWYILRNNATMEERKLVLEGDNRCSECNKVYRQVRKSNKRNLDIPLEKRLHRTDSSSKYPIRLLSPQSKAIRLENLKKINKKQSAQLRKYEKQLGVKSLHLNDQQSGELQEFVQSIPKKALEEAHQQTSEEDDMPVANQVLFECDQKSHRE